MYSVSTCSNSMYMSYLTNVLYSIYILNILMWASVVWFALNIAMVSNWYLLAGHVPVIMGIYITMRIASIVVVATCTHVVTICTLIGILYVWVECGRRSQAILVWDVLIINGCGIFCGTC